MVSPQWPPLKPDCRAVVKWMSPQWPSLTHDCPCRAFVKLVSPEWLRQCLERQVMLSPESFEIPVMSLGPAAPQAGQQLQPSASGFAGGQRCLFPGSSCMWVGL